MIRWVFLDIGGPILDDSPWILEVDRTIAECLEHRKLHFTPAQVTGARLEAVRTRMPSSVKGAIALLAGDSLVQAVFRESMAIMVPQYVDRAALRPGIIPVLEELSGRYKLGLIANQPKEVHQVLEKLGVRRYFRVAAISGDLGFAKPDRRIFQYALEESGCIPPEAAFIGDRLDNDIRPARQLGFRTIWFRDGYLKETQKPQVPDEVAEESVNDIGELPAAVERLGSSGTASDTT